RPDDPRRLAALIGHTLRRAAARGHTAVEEKRLAAVVGKLGVQRPTDALEVAETAEATVVFESIDDTDDDFDLAEGGVPDLPDPERFHSLPEVGHAEQRLGEQLLRLIGANDPIMDSATAEETVEASAEKYGLDVDERTRQALITVALRPVTVLWHGPCALTTLARAVLCMDTIASDSRVGISAAAPPARSAATLITALADVVAAPPVQAVSRETLLKQAPWTSGLVVLTEAMPIGTARPAGSPRCAPMAHIWCLPPTRTRPRRP